MNKLTELFRIDVSKELDGLMIKEILFDHYNFSRKSLSKIKNAQGIFLNQEPVYVTRRVSIGDLLQIYSIEETSEEILPQQIPLNIFYEDEDIVVINKPANIVIHPTRNHYLGTIANGLIYYWQSKGEIFRFRPVNRLDKDTSGLFIVAKNQYSHHKLALQIKSNSLKRTYHAIVHGNVQNDSGVIDAPILKDDNHATKRLISFDDSNAKQAITYYRVLERFGDFTLVELRLATGRTHQIRVHMSYLNHPLVGDDLYGGKNLNSMERQALHAINLKFHHPITDKLLEFSAPYPDDFRLFISQFL